MSKNKKVVIGIFIAVSIIVISVVVAYKLIEKSITDREEFKYIVDDISSSPVDTINNEQNVKSFFGKVIEAEMSYIVVEPNEGEDIRKSSDKISIGLDEQKDALYEVGTNVKITYDGNIMESYPARIKATMIEVKSADNFEIIFKYRQPNESYNKIYAILDKSETTKYNYTIYAYDGSVNIRIDGKEYNLKETLLENKITMEEIIAKANQDDKDGKIKSEMYKDGGSMEYHYENYTIIKCHTLDGNRDVYIGPKDLKLTDVWKENGITKDYEYGILTNEIYQEWSGMKASQYKEYKGLRKESLRDNMTDIEVALTDLGEIATRELAYV